MPGIFICGEAYGREEKEQGKPFVGASGRLLNGLLRQVGIDRDSCYITNVFNFQPPGNDIKKLCGPKVDGIKGMPAIVKSKYLDKQYEPELERLYGEVHAQQPTLIIALGASAAWALLKTTGIRSIRGAPWLAHIRGNSYKVLPTYHPSAILREWKLRPILLADLHKAVGESGYPEIRRPQRHIWIEPTLDDLTAFELKYIVPSKELSVDIETAGDQITCIGFAPSINQCLVVPFYDDTKPSKNYWASVSDEVKAWKWVKRMCEHERATIVGQNVLYDINVLWSKYGIKLKATDDTMLLHHALQPEMEKGLGFLGSIYTNEAAWKTEYKHSKTNKRED